MHEFPVVPPDMATTSRKDFVCHDVMAMARQRRDALDTNRVSPSLLPLINEETLIFYLHPSQARHEHLAVELSCGQDKNSEQCTTSGKYTTPYVGLICTIYLEIVLV